SPKNPSPATNPDTYGRPRELTGTVWQNYALEGTQIDFVTPTGKPTILSDQFVEFGFQRSSCISCHATANIAPDGGFVGLQAKALCALNGSVPEIGLTVEACKQEIGAHLYRPGEDKLFDEYGTPYARWYKKDGKPFYLQTDFLWSITFRGRPETSPPPSRCIW
ncbi:MAG: hypothetical protein MN733_38845, partial [Nitrososphaera sp.]|nr:hypothetical protein [Nitrososphaera sp.]